MSAVRVGARHAPLAHGQGLQRSCMPAVGDCAVVGLGLNNEVATGYFRSMRLCGLVISQSVFFLGVFSFIFLFPAVMNLACLELLHDLLYAAAAFCCTVHQTLGKWVVCYSPLVDAAALLRRAGCWWFRPRAKHFLEHLWQQQLYNTETKQTELTSMS